MTRSPVQPAGIQLLPFAGSATAALLLGGACTPPSQSTADELAIKASSVETPKQSTSAPPPRNNTFTCPPPSCIREVSANLPIAERLQGTWCGCFGHQYLQIAGSTLKYRNSSWIAYKAATDGMLVPGRNWQFQLEIRDGVEHLEWTIFDVTRIAYRSNSDDCSCFEEHGNQMRRDQELSSPAPDPM